MKNQASEPEEFHEPTDAEMEAWLMTPDGMAAMREVMEATLSGKYGAVPEEMLHLSREGLKRHHSYDVVQEVKACLHALKEKMHSVVQDGPDGSLWACVREMNEELKAIMDLILEIHEPRRSELMPGVVELQQDLEALMKTL